eukprot:SAG11_NODE_6429_length_1315_cov_1.216283_2_plen_166_part_00
MRSGLSGTVTNTTSLEVSGSFVPRVIRSKGHLSKGLQSKEQAISYIMTSLLETDHLLCDVPLCASQINVVSWPISGSQETWVSHLPNSSTSTRLFVLAWLSTAGTAPTIWDISFISSMKLDSLFSISSFVDVRVKIRSMHGVAKNSAGTKLPVWDRIVRSATCFR